MRIVDLMKRFKKGHTSIEGDRWLVLELRDKTVRMTRVGVQPNQRLFTVYAQCSAAIMGANEQALGEAVESVCKRMHLHDGERLFLVVDRAWGVTRTFEVSIGRSDRTVPIAPAECAALVDRGICKALREQQEFMAQSLNVPIDGVRIIDADVVRVRIDGKRMLNPIGFNGRTIDITYRATGIRTSVLAAIAGSLTEDNLAGTIEAGMSMALEVALRCASGDFVFGYSADSTTAVYRCADGVITYADSFGWGTQTLYEGIAKQYGASLTFAEDLLALYASGEVSRAVALSVERAAAGELALLGQGIYAQQQRATVAYVYAERLLPRILFNEQFMRRLRVPTMIHEVNERILGVHGGFGVHYVYAHDGAPRDHALIAAVLAAQYGSLGGGSLHRGVLQRVRWLRAGEHH